MIINDEMQNFIKNTEHKYTIEILDPPYGNIVKAEWDSKCFKFTFDIIRDLYNILEDGGSLYIHCGMGNKSNSLVEWFNQFENYKQYQKENKSKEYFFFQDTITNRKTRGIGMRRGFLQVSEHNLWFTKNTHKHIWNKENQYSNEKRAFDIVKAGGVKVNSSEFKRLTTVWDIPELGYGKSPKMLKKIKKHIQHLTPKHPLLSNRMIKAHCDSKSRVLLPFAGSGMEILSCLYNNLEFDAIDSDKVAIDLINEYVMSGIIKYEDFI